MSPQESGSGDPAREHPAGGQYDGGAAPSGGMGPVPPADQQPWAPPAGGQAWQQPADQHPWQPPRAWQQPSPGSPYGTAPYGTAPYGTAPYGTPPYGMAPNGYSPYGQPRYAAPPKPGIVPLRPLMFGEILDGAFHAIRRNPGAMLGAALLAQSLAAIVAAVVTTSSAVSAGSIEAWAETAPPAALASAGLGFLAGVVLFSILAVFVSVVLQGAMVVPVARSALNRRTGFRRMWQLSRSRTWALVRLAALLMAAGVLAVVLLGAAMALLFSNARGMGILLAIPLFFVVVLLFAWVAVKFLVAPAAVVVEELGAFGGLRRSWELTRANWWRIFGITAVVSILVGVISQLALIPVTFVASFLATVVSPHGGSGQQAATAVAAGIATAVLGALAGAVGYAFQTSVMALLYLDLRMRKDGLDVTLLRQHESGADPGVPGRGVLPGVAGPYPGYGAPAQGWPDGR
ncbi:DUF7847 domain-containing protein [Arthrobacter sp. C152]